MHHYASQQEETTSMSVTHHNTHTHRTSIYTIYIKQKTNTSIETSRTSGVTDGGQKNPG